MTDMTVVVRNDVDADMLNALVDAKSVACDIETTGLNPLTDRIGTVQLHSPTVGDVVLQVGTVKPERLCRLVSDRRVRKVFHHAMFDLRFMVAHWDVKPANISCTKIASKLLEPKEENANHSLQSLLMRHLGVSISKDQRRSNWLDANLTSDQLRYATADVNHLLELLDSLERGLRSQGLIELFSQCLAFIPARVRLDLGDWPDVFTY